MDWPQHILAEVDAAVRDLTLTGKGTQTREAVKVAVLHALAPHVGALSLAMEEVRSEACICHMDYGSDCQCEAGWTAGEALERWQKGDNRDDDSDRGLVDRELPPARHQVDLHRGAQGGSRPVGRIHTRRTPYAW